MITGQVRRRFLLGTCCLAATCCIWTCLFTAALAAEPRVILGKPAPNFTLADESRRPVSLPTPEDARLVVIAFLGTECPLAKLYAPRLQKIAGEYRDRGVRVIGLMPNIQDSRDEIAAFGREYQLQFPLLKDDGVRVADAYGATRTPEVFLLDASRVVRYQGRVDDQGMVGLVRTKTGREHLREAIGELLAGKPVSQPKLATVGCLIGRPRVATTAAQKTETPVTYANQVSRIFQKRCLDCHREGEIGPFSMEDYEEVAGWADMIQEVVDQGRMPPWFASPKHGTFSNDARMTEEEKRTIADWVEAGAPFGDASDLPKPKEYVEGWNIGVPDQVVAMAEKPYSVPAEGVIPYKHFVVDPGFAEDHWMTGCEVRPGSREVVHHVLVFCRVPGQRKMLDEFNGGLVAAYAPGLPAFQAPAGAARRLPAGSRIVIQVHYTPNGRAQEDLTRVGFTYCDGKDVKQEIESRGANSFLILIPPHAANHKITSRYVFDQPRWLYNMTPHMHLRGKSFRFEARYPDGRTEILLDVPQYDFNWQVQYNLAEPKFMPKGTRLVCTGHYDNSANNPANPDPDQWIRFGEQTWDEMMIGWFTAMAPVDGDKAGRAGVARIKPSKSAGRK